MASGILTGRTRVSRNDHFNICHAPQSLYACRRKPERRVDQSLPAPPAVLSASSGRGEVAAGLCELQGY